MAANVTSKCSSAFLDPTSDLSPGTSYIVTITGVKDSAGNALATPYTGIFSTGSPVSVQATKAITAGRAHTLSLKSDGTLWSWGDNISGQLGDGTTIIKTTPKQIGTATNWSAISAGGDHTLALKSDGTLWAWGFNYATFFTPTQIGTATNWSAISAGGGFAIGLKSDGTLWAWGDNSSGQLGDGTTTNKTTPTQIGTATNWSAISAGGFHTTALKSDGTLWAWGDNSLGQLGVGTITNKTTPTQIGTDINWNAIAAGGNSNGGAGSRTIALKSDGTLWAWGSNGYGQLGDGTTTTKTTPTQIGTATNWSAIAAGGDHTLALKSDGTLWAWGSNWWGQLGDGTTTNKTTPTQIGTATNWTAISAGSNHTIALKSDGTLWAWGLNSGFNSSGQLGDGTTTDKITPVQINSSSATVASTPSGVTATAGNAQLAVSWSNASGATSYDVYYSTASSVSTTTGTKVTCATAPYTIMGLTAGTTYYVIVVASNGYGDSTPSSSVNATTTGGGTGGGTYYWANWTCPSSACTSIMGRPSGSAGPLCSQADCIAFTSTSTYVPLGATCSTTATYTKYVTDTPSNGVCWDSGVDF